MDIPAADKDAAGSAAPGNAVADGMAVRPVALERPEGWQGSLAALHAAGVVKKVAFFPADPGRGNEGIPHQRRSSRSRTRGKSCGNCDMYRDTGQLRRYTVGSGQSDRVNEALKSKPCNLWNMTFDLSKALAETGARALLFDMDGTLIDNMGYHRQAWLKWARGEGIPGTDEEIMALTHGTLLEIVHRFFPDEHDVEARRVRGGKKEALYREIYRPHLRLIPGLAEVLETARERGIPMAVATAGDKTNIDFTLDGLGVRPYFQAIVGAEDVTHGKPHPEVFLRAAEKLELPPGACLVFEDSPAGVEAALRAGMPCFVVNPMNPIGEFGETGHALHFAEDYLSVVWERSS